MNEVLLILGMTLVTFLPRYGVLALMGRIEMPQPLFKALRYVPVTVLSAIIAPDLLLKDGSVNLALNNSFLAAGIIAILVSWRTKNLLLTIVLGMAALWVWRAVFPV
ncbi:MAG: AzlD domain-containing protein [Chloroflexi bacterium]|nr:AzlD domain-containing protein [Chloroflexota bacterium]MCC6894270.1 AzlD domain-containing protein [Anaerolineae bacterium]